jgi:hypothetical protein
MMKNFFLSYKNPVSVIIAVIIAGGLFLYSQIKVSLFPEITFPKIKTITPGFNCPHPKALEFDCLLRPLRSFILLHNLLGERNFLGSCNAGLILRNGNIIEAEI